MGRLCQYRNRLPAKPASISLMRLSTTTRIHTLRILGIADYFSPNLIMTQSMLPKPPISFSAPWKHTARSLQGVCLALTRWGIKPLSNLCRWQGRGMDGRTPTPRYIASKTTAGWMSPDLLRLNLLLKSDPYLRSTTSMSGCSSGSKVNFCSLMSGLVSIDVISYR